MAHNFEDIMTLGTVVRQLRENKGISQGNLADMIGVEQSWVSRLESDKLDPPLSKIDSLAKALDVKRSELFGIAERSLVIKVESIVVENNPHSINFANHVKNTGNFDEERKVYKQHIEDLKVQIEDMRKLIDKLLK